MTVDIWANGPAQAGLKRAILAAGNLRQNIS
jgi:hypothetical protein